jgi:hypothetical protein
MRKPWVVGLLSVVPGLGLIVLGQAVKGLAIMVAMAFLTLLFLTLGSSDLSAVFFTFALILWVSQLYYAVVVAQRLARAEAGLALPEREAAIAPLPAGASTEEKALHNTRKTLMGLLLPGEHLRVGVYGSTGLQAHSLVDLGLALLSGDAPLTGESVRQVHLGIVKDELAFVKADAFGKPAHLERIPLKQVSLVKYREHMLSDELVLDIGEEKPLTVAVGRPMRKGTRELVSILPK